MTDKKNSEIRLDDAVAAVKADVPDASQLRVAGERVLANLMAPDGAASAVEQIRGCADVRSLIPAFRAGELTEARAQLVETHLRECNLCHVAFAGSTQPAAWKATVAPARSSWSARQFALAAAMVLAIATGSWFVMQTYFSSPAGMRASVQSVDGALFRVSGNGQVPVRAGDEVGDREILRTAGESHAFVRLIDGSVVEMNERSEFSVGARRKDTTVYLNQGRIIVQAAHRRTGHLFVVTPEARVAVTGTVFSVNSGIKGVRVAVIEGEVHVEHSGVEDVLHSGDQVASGDRMTQVPVRDEIAWSRNLDKHLALLAQFAKLQNKLQQIPMPGLRYSSTLLPRVPADTMIYASIPNIGEAINEANRIFQEQMQQSPELREWWAEGKHKNNGGPSFEEALAKIHSLSQYLGDEVVLVATPGQKGPGTFVIMAEVRRQGLREFLESEFKNLGHNSKDQILVVDDSQLASAGKMKGGLIALVRPDVVMFSGDAESLQRIASSAAPSGAFQNTEFGQRISSSYAQGAGFLLAVDLKRIMEQEPSGTRKGNRDARQHQKTLQTTGFGDARYLIAEHRDGAGAKENRAEFEFSGQRHGIASWLAAPAPMGSLEFVSPSAGMATAVIAKSPALMMDDIMQLAALSDSKSNKGFAELESKLGINLRDDLAASLGGEVTFALDGPLLPKPAWKLIAQVYDSSRLQSAISRMVEAANRELSAHQQPGVELKQEEVDGRVFYMLRSLNPKAAAVEMDYTYSDGYLVASSSRALVMSALKTKQSGNSLARSSQLQALMPKDEHANFSGLFYQNLAPVIAPIASQLTPSQLKSLQEIAVESKPTIVCAYGGDSSIEIVSGDLLPFNLNQLALASMLGRNSGAAHK